MFVFIDRRERVGGVGGDEVGEGRAVGEGVVAATAQGRGAYDMDGSSRGWGAE